MMKGHQGVSADCDEKLCACMSWPDLLQGRVPQFVSCDFWVLLKPPAGFFAVLLPAILFK